MSPRSFHAPSHKIPPAQLPCVPRAEPTRPLRTQRNTQPAHRPASRHADAAAVNAACPLAIVWHERRPCRLAWSRTPPFHGGDTGSNPVRVIRVFTMGSHPFTPDATSTQTSRGSVGCCDPVSSGVAECAAGFVPAFSPAPTPAARSRCASRVWRSC